MTHEWLGCHFAPAQHYANSKGLAGFIPLICRKMMAWPSEKGSHLEKFRPNHWNWVISKWFSGSICSILKAFFSEPRGLQGTLTFSSRCLLGEVRPADHQAFTLSGLFEHGEGGRGNDHLGDESGKATVKKATNINRHQGWFFPCFLLKKHVYIVHISYIYI